MGMSFQQAALSREKEDVWPEGTRRPYETASLGRALASVSRQPTSRSPSTGQSHGHGISVSLRKRTRCGRGQTWLPRPATCHMLEQRLSICCFVGPQLDEAHLWPRSLCSRLRALCAPGSFIQLALAAPRVRPRLWRIVMSSPLAVEIQPRPVPTKSAAFTRAFYIAIIVIIE